LSPWYWERERDYRASELDTFKVKRALAGSANWLQWCQPPRGGPLAIFDYGFCPSLGLRVAIVQRHEWITTQPLPNAFFRHFKLSRPQIQNLTPTNYLAIFIFACLKKNGFLSLELKNQHSIWVLFILEKNWKS